MNINNEKVFDLFISHSSKTKDLAKYFWFNAMYNDLSAWYDESLLAGGDELIPKIQLGIDSSKGFVLLHCKEAVESRWVQAEMLVAKNRKETDASFKIVVIKLDDSLLDEWWKKYKFESWDHEDVPGSMLKFFEAMTGKKVMLQFVTAALLNGHSEYFLNESSTVAEQVKNFTLYYFSHIKKLLSSSLQGHPSELADTVGKVLKLHLMNLLPSLSGGAMQIEPGIWEYVFSVRMRIPPTISIEGLPPEYRFEEIEKNEVSAKVKIVDAKSGVLIKHIVPMSFKVWFSAEL